MAIEATEFVSWSSGASKRLASLALKVGNVCPRPSHMAHPSLALLSLHLYEVAGIVKEMQQEAALEGLRPSTRSTKEVESHLGASDQIVETYSGSSSLYLLMCSPALLAQLKFAYEGLKFALNSLSDDANWSDSVKMRCSEEIQALTQSLSAKISTKEQSLHDFLGQGVLDSIATDATLTVKLAKQVAEAIGLDTRSEMDMEYLANEVDKLKLEKDEVVRRRGAAHAMFIEQFVTLLEKGMTPAPEMYFSRSSSAQTDADHHGMFGSQSRSSSGPLIARDTMVLPLQSFICPITQDVMRDPVQIASGQTYERSAIERWFADGHTRCPTGVELPNTHMKSNIALKQSIAEWRDRNNNIRLDVAAEYIHSSGKDKHLKALRDLYALCQEDSLYKYKVASRGMVPCVVGIAESDHLEVRIRSFSLLGLLVDNEECQEAMIKENIINLMVRCLARQNDDMPLCLRLMRTLSNKSHIAERIACVPSAVLFLVTCLQHDKECADHVNAVLENLPRSDSNIVTMAEASIMTPLIERLNHAEANVSSKVLMARTLARLHMPEASKTLTATEETIRTLASMAESPIDEEMEAAILAMENLSSVAAARQRLQAVGAAETLLKILKGSHHSETATRASAAVLANCCADRDAFSWSPAQVEEAVHITLDLLTQDETSTQVQLPLLDGLISLARDGCNAEALECMKQIDVFTCLLRLIRFHASKMQQLASIEPILLQLRCRCVELLSCVAAFFPDKAAEALRLNTSSIHDLANLVAKGNSYSGAAELQAVVSFLACLPRRDIEITRLMLSESDLVRALTFIFKQNRSQAIVEAAAGALLRFTEPVDLTLQITLARAGVIQKYVGLLRSGGLESKKHAANALCNFSKNSWKLSSDANDLAIQTKLRVCTLPGLSRWTRSHRQVLVCPLHGGLCSVEGTFCLVEADAVSALAEVLKANMEDGDATGGVQTAALRALSTLIVTQAGGSQVEESCAAIDRTGAWSTIISLLSRGSTPAVKAAAARLCEHLLRIPRYRTEYAARAQAHVVMLAQDESSQLRELAGRLLHRLGFLQASESGYFGGVSTIAS
ncbi:hypothetical protein KP509_18G018200 [Ceratopteris richardii]|uniref:RING-type E3 ubiquitin transferase n=1 Tax=Ceratopteris richardii TaxID=49495 RepID=A0A8T2SRK4_CERRI|nr:hypothetical protein KP509_18G018200 [Ceratopteris richardii]